MMYTKMDYEGINRYWSDYTIVDELGSGAYGKVYGIQKNQFGNEVSSAVKIIHFPPDKNYKKDLLLQGMTEENINAYYLKRANQILQENAIMEKLKGATNIVSVEDCKAEKDYSGDGYTIYIKMERLKSLHSLAINKMSAEDIVKIGMDLCDALIACENYKIVHRDIKPANVFIDSSGRYKLGDFGVAREMRHDKTDMTMIGTTQYMAPELYNQLKSDKRVDIYSLGIMLYRFANEGRFPFVNALYVTPDDNAKALAKRLIGEPLPLPMGVDEDLGNIILKACMHRPEQRYSSALELKKDLKKWKEKQTVSEQKSLDSALEQRVAKLEEEVNILRMMLQEMRTKMGYVENSIDVIHGSCADQEADVIVNATNRKLAPGIRGVSGAIYDKAGRKELELACRQYPTPLKDGSVVITSSFKMKNAKAIIHAVGPNFSVTPKAFPALHDAYYNSLTTMKKYGYHSISFPLISSGSYGLNLLHPAMESARCCLSAYNQFTEDYPEYEIKVKLCAFSEGEYMEAKSVFNK